MEQVNLFHGLLRYQLEKATRWVVGPDTGVDEIRESSPSSRGRAGVHRTPALNGFDSLFFPKIKGHPMGGGMRRIQESMKSGSRPRRAGNEQVSTGHLHIIGSTPSSFPKNKRPPFGWPFIFGAGYGSRTRLHGLGNIKADFTLYSLNRKKCSICNGFSVFSKW